MSFCVLLLITIIVSMVYFVASKGISTFTSGNATVSEFLFGTKWSPEADTPSFGAFPFISGSFLVTLLAALIASPLSLCAALFMTEIVPGWGKKLLQPVIELLAGIPSVVYGFIGLSVIVPFLRNNLPGQGIGVAARRACALGNDSSDDYKRGCRRAGFIAAKLKRIFLCAWCHPVADDFAGDYSNNLSCHNDRDCIGNGSCFR